LHDLALLFGLPLGLAFGYVLGSACLELFGSLLHPALPRVGLSLTRRRIASLGPAVGLLLEEGGRDTLSVRFDELLWDAHHAEDFRLDVLAAFHGVVDDGEGDFVHLLQVHEEATSSVKAPVAVVALEMLGFLVVDEDLLVVEVALAVVAPRARENVLDGGVVALLLGHGCGVVGDVV
jgi:hypothetical protein